MQFDGAFPKQAPHLRGISKLGAGLGAGLGTSGEHPLVGLSFEGIPGGTVNDGLL